MIYVFKQNNFRYLLKISAIFFIYIKKSSNDHDLGFRWSFYKIYFYKEYAIHTKYTFTHLLELAGSSKTKVKVTNFYFNFVKKLLHNIVIYKKFEYIFTGKKNKLPHKNLPTFVLQFYPINVFLGVINNQND